MAYGQNGPSCESLTWLSNVQKLSSSRKLWRSKKGSKTFHTFAYSAGSNMLQQVPLTLITPTQCAAFPFFQTDVTNNIICAGGSTLDTCQVSIYFTFNQGSGQRKPMAGPKYGVQMVKPLRSCSHWSFWPGTQVNAGRTRVRSSDTLARRNSCGFNLHRLIGILNPEVNSFVSMTCDLTPSWRVSVTVLCNSGCS